MATTKTVRRILCPIDFSDASPKVADYAATLARSAGAEIMAVYVAPEMNRYAKMYVAPNMIDTLEQDIVKGAEDKMESFLKKDFAGLKASGKVVIGYAPEAIVDLARALDADMIVMGSHGRKAIDRIIFGSVAEKVVKTSPVPVMTVR